MLGFFVIILSHVIVKRQGSEEAFRGNKKRNRQGFGEIMINFIVTRLVWFYFGGIVAVYPFAVIALERGSSTSQVIKDWLLWPGLYF